MNKISKITMGTWGLSEWKMRTKKYCEYVVSAAYDKGIRSFDTAPVYGVGKAETCLSLLPKDCFIATKIPSQNRSENIIEAYEPSWIEDNINESLNRLKRESLDLVQLHNWKHGWKEYSFLIDKLNEIKNKGLVNRWGISLPHEPLQENDPIFNESIFEYFQIHYNLLQRQNLGMIKTLKQKEKTVLLRSVLFHGFLLGKHNSPFEKKYYFEKEELIEKRESLFSNLEEKDRFKCCLEDAFSTGADSLVLGITKIKDVEDIQKYMRSTKH